MQARTRTQFLNDDGTTEEPRDEDAANAWQEPDLVIRRAAYLTEDVTQADLAKYPEHQLIGRRNYYERQYTFEISPKIRQQFKREMERTEIELNRRAMYRRSEAERVFEL